MQGTKKMFKNQYPKRIIKIYITHKTRIEFYGKRKNQNK